MKCERCGRNEATFYYQSNINGRVTQVHLCPDCAAELGWEARCRVYEKYKKYLDSLGE